MISGMDISVGGLYFIVINLLTFLLYGLDKLMQEKTGITTMLAEDPLTAVAIGTGKSIDMAGEDDDF